jgi:hypothetical protein
MNDNNDVLYSGIICIVFLASIGVTLLVGHSYGFGGGVVDGKNKGIVFCMEKQKECKISYEYLKLQENQK